MNSPHDDANAIAVATIVVPIMFPHIDHLPKIRIPSDRNPIPFTVPVKVPPIDSMAIAPAIPDRNPPNMFDRYLVLATEIPADASE